MEFFLSMKNFNFLNEAKCSVLLYNFSILEGTAKFFIYFILVEGSQANISAKEKAQSEESNLARKMDLLGRTQSDNQIDSIGIHEDKNKKLVTD